MCIIGPAMSEVCLSALQVFLRVSDPCRRLPTVGDASKIALPGTISSAIARTVTRVRLSRVLLGLRLSCPRFRYPQLFVKHKDSPPISHNLPPVAGALTWSKGLLERVSLPMAKITGFNKKACCRPTITVLFLSKKAGVVFDGVCQNDKIAPSAAHFFAPPIWLGAARSHQNRRLRAVLAPKT